MKKIVALVLALAMALSLATVAFAANDTYFADAVGSKNKIASGDKLVVSMEKVSDATDSSVATYAIYVTMNGNKFPLLGKYVEATSANYDCVFVCGKEITYLKSTISGKYTGEATPVAALTLADAAAAKCGDYVVNDGVTLYNYNGKILKAADSINVSTVVKSVASDIKTELMTDLTMGLTKEEVTTEIGTLVVKYGKLSNFADVNTAKATFASALQDMADWAQDVRDAYNNATATPTDILDSLDPSTNSGVSAENFDVLAALVDAFQSNFASLASGTTWNEVASETTLKDKALTVLKALGSDAMDEIVSKVCAALGITSSGTVTDADFIGDNILVDLARAIVKPALSVRAVALVDGKIVTLAAADKADLDKTYDTKTGKLTSATIDGDYALISHSYAVDYANVSGVTSITKVYCSECGAAFEFVVGNETAAVEKFGAGNYTNITNDFKYAFTTKFLGYPVVNFNWDAMKFESGWSNGTGYTWNMFDTDSRNIKAALNGGQLWISAAAVADPTEAEPEKAVESSKTFDAGVALYAGMAIMSVAGSAVVIGKKKEF